MVPRPTRRRRPDRSSVCLRSRSRRSRASCPSAATAGCSRLGTPIWYTYGTEYVMRETERPCVRERLPIRAPVDGVVISIDEVPDGGVTIEGPPHLRATFSHVTPRPGLSVGSAVRAGNTIATIATMYTHTRSTSPSPTLRSRRIAGSARSAIELRSAIYPRRTRLRSIRNRFAPGSCSS